MALRKSPPSKGLVRRLPAAASLAFVVLGCTPEEVTREQSRSNAIGGVSLPPTAQEPALAPNAGAPVWTAIEQPGEPIEYYRYDSVRSADADHPELNCSPGFNCELGSTTRDAFHPEVNFFWQPSAPVGFRTARSGCAVTDQPDKHIFWFDQMSHQPLASADSPHYPVPPPGEFTVSSRYFELKGFTVKGFPFGSAAGSPPGAAASAIMYFTDRRCSDGNNEYGFNYNLTTRSVGFYYSTKTNCYGGWGCRAGASWDSPPQNQQDDLSTRFGDVTNAVANPPSPLVYLSAYFVPDPPSPGFSSGYKFRVQIVDGYDTTQLARCRVDDRAELGPCAKDVRIKDFFPVADVAGPAGGYIVLGTSTSYSSTGDLAPRWAAGPTYFNVRGVWAGK